MKTETTTETRTLTHTTFTCDEPGCEFSTKAMESAKQHYANKHSFKKESEIDDTTFYWFETAEDYRSFHEDSGNRCRDYEAARFKGPGWYGMQRWTNSYDETDEAAISTSAIAASWQRDIEDLEKKIQKLKINFDELNKQLK